jgi:DNA-directed RNA polymerase specialized sigma24 family protein
MAEDARNTEPSFRDSALQYLDGLYAYAMTLARNEAEAEDPAQETYLRAVRAFDRFRPDSNLKSWLKQADVRKAIEDLPAAYREVIVLRECSQAAF